MRIKSIALKKFKFHHALEFDIEQENCLIYGENGTGKSSIYWAIKSIFKPDLMDDIQKYKTFGSAETESPNVNINIENNIQLDTKDVESQIPKENTNTIYFLHQDLSDYIVSEENFYIVIEELLIKHFTEDFSSYISTFNNINNDIGRANHISKSEEREENIREVESFLNSLELRSNDIIHHHFEEPFSISFHSDWGSSQIEKGIYKFSKPKIVIKIDNKEELKLNFNEAKLKLTSIAIFFALIKLNENLNNSLKLLVLDDFLTSIDMGNRKLIVQYILDNFEEYQKIILTHNIQFYNLIVKLLKIRNENKVWDIKNIFLAKESIGETAIIKETTVDYLYRAKKELIQGEFHSSGNYLRKEFERIVHEFKQLLEIGKTEKLQNMIDALKSNDIIFSIEPHDLLNQINNYIPNLIGILNSTMNDDRKIFKVKELLEKINDLIIEKKCDLSNIKATLEKVEFYRSILFNPASHSDTEIEIYRKECLSSIQLLEELNIILKNLK